MKGKKRFKFKKIKGEIKIEEPLPSKYFDKQGHINMEAVLQLEMEDMFLTIKNAGFI